MRQKLSRKLYSFQDLSAQIKTRFLARTPRTSIFFFTLHKCATSLFSSYVLKNLDGLAHVDYAKQLASGRRTSRTPLKFHRKGVAFGPMRISQQSQNMISRLLIEPVCDPDFLRERTAVFLVRDPRDILVSEYYSFGYTHGLSQVEDLRREQIRKRAEIQDLSLDDYVLSAAPQQRNWFNQIHELEVICDRSVILRYEDMVESFDTFLEAARKLLPISDSVAEEMYRRSRPKKKEDQSSHRRSGKTQGFRAKLKTQTIANLNQQFWTVLLRFGYES